MLKQLLSLLIFGLLFACANDATSDADTDLMEDDGAAVTNTVDEEAVKDLSSYTNDVQEKLDEIIQMKADLIALESVPAEAKEGVDSAIRIAEQMENQVERWLDNATNLQAQAGSVDEESFDGLLEQEIETGAFYSNQLDQVKRMLKGQMNRARIDS